MDFPTYTTKSPDEVIHKLASSKENGLSQTSVKQLQKQYGPNLIQAHSVYWWQILVKQLSSSFVYLLLVAACLSFLLKEYLDGSMILLFVTINTLLGFYQEYHSEQTVRLLKRYLVPKVRVRRDGQEMLVDSPVLVPGDIIIIQVGDIIPADVRFLTTQNLSVDESALTGESFPVEKTASALRQEIKTINSAENIGFSGTTVVGGEAEGIVITTGKKTVIGGVTKLTLETERKTGFEKAIKQLSQFILYLVLITLTLVFLSHLLIKPSTNSIELLLFSIALAVSVIPEALPVVTTFSLSQGALRLAKNKVVVKRLSAIEDLGSIEVLCTDKTGTLTENCLTISSICSKQPSETIFYANLAGYMLAGQKEPTVSTFDKAMWEKEGSHQKSIFAKYKKVAEIPFDPQRRRDAILVKYGRQYELIVRGAPELLLKSSKNLNKQEKQKFNQWLIKEGQEGHRVLGVAKMSGIKGENYDLTLTDDHKNLTFLGLISFTDPIKKSTWAAVKQAQQLGIEIKILTGDRKEVASTIATQVGLIKSPEAVITGEEFEQLSPIKQAKAVHQFSVFARVSPQQKYLIVQLLQKDKDVGFLGEGINDAPALKVANVALVVQGASDIAREAADIVLLKKSLAVIIDGIKEGRKVFANTIKYIKTTLVSNFGNFYAIAIVSLLIDYLPLLPLQILLLNLLSDFPMIAVATDTVDTEELLQPKKYQVKDIAFIATILGSVSTVFDFILFGLFMHLGANILRTNWFIGSILTELILIFSLRTRFFAFAAKRPSFILAALSVAASLFTILLPYINLGQQIFAFVPPSTTHLWLIFIIVLLYFATSESVKLAHYHFGGPNKKKQNRQ